MRDAHYDPNRGHERGYQGAAGVRSGGSGSTCTGQSTGQSTGGYGAPAGHSGAGARYTGPSPASYTDASSSYMTLEERQMAEAIAESARMADAASANLPPLVSNTHPLTHLAQEYASGARAEL